MKTIPDVCMYVCVVCVYVCGCVCVSVCIDRKGDVAIIVFICRYVQKTSQ